MVDIVIVTCSVGITGQYAKLETPKYDIGLCLHSVRWFQMKRILCFFALIFIISLELPIAQGGSILLWPSGTGKYPPSPYPYFVQRLTVSRYTDTTLSNADVDRIFSDASYVLQTNDGSGDVACNVELARYGNVTVFNNGDDGSIDTEEELSEVFNLPSNVKVVDDVNWCANQFNTSFIGCGQLPGRSFITERFTENQEGILWLHEFGHNQGLHHRTDTSDAVMFPSIGINRIRINSDECSAYRANNEGAQPNTSGMQNWSMENQLIRADLPVQEFVSHIYTNGLPLGKAATYGENDVDVLLNMLIDPKQEAYHENIALTLGMIGSKRAIEPLIARINKDISSAIEKEEARRAYKGAVGAVIALGYILNRTGDETALKYLMDSSSPKIWENRKIKGISEIKKNRNDLGKYAIIALGLSGNTKAKMHLDNLRDQKTIRTQEEDIFLKRNRVVVPL